MLTENVRENESFQQILERSLNNKFNSRPPKIEISGTLTPVHTMARGKTYRFKIVSDSAEYLLNLNAELTEAAKKYEWEDVTAKGYLDINGKILTVERLCLNRIPDDLQLNTRIKDSYYDLDFYRKTISQFGYLEPEPGYLAS